MDLNLDKYLPHRYPMRFIDAVLSIDAKLAQCETTITTNNIFYDADIGGVYSWLGLELMAQTAGVFAYVNQPQVDPKVGLLISVRNFFCTQPFFKLNDVLVITAENIYLHEDIGVFNCQIAIAGGLVATAKLSAIQSFVPKEK